MDKVYLFGSNTKEEVAINMKYECDFCSQTFQSQPERRCHTIQHFQQKSCGNCHTNLIRIADDWYELHVSANCNKGNGNYNLPTDNDKEADAEHSIKQEVVAETAAFLDDFPNDTLKISPSKSNSNANAELQDYFDCSAAEFVQISESNKLDCSPASNTMTQWNADCSLEDDDDDDDDEVADDDEYDEPMNMNVEHLDKPAKMAGKKIPVVKKRLERRVHRPKSNFTCDICKKVLTSFKSLEFHMIHIHYPEAVKKSVCKICDNSYSSKSQLKKHMLLHDAAKPFMCSYCAKGFVIKKLLLDHEKVHNGIKPYSCTICEKSFQGYHSFRHHMRVTHSDERNFKCEIDNCKWAFKQKAILIRHKARVHGLVKNRFPCPICSKEFPESKYHLQRHLKQAHHTNG